MLDDNQMIPAPTLEKPSKAKKTGPKVPQKKMETASKKGWQPGDWGALGVCRFQTGGDLPAAVFLYHLKWRLRGTNGDLGRVIGMKEEKDPNSGKIVHVPVTERSGPVHKVLTRKGKQWIAASRSTWAKEAGLTLREYDRAIRELRRYGLVEARNYKLGSKVSVWIRVVWEDLPKLRPDEVELHEMKRASGFRILGGKKDFHPKRHRLNRKAINAEMEACMREMAKKAMAKKSDSVEAQIVPLQGTEFSPTENSGNCAEVQNLEV